MTTINYNNAVIFGAGQVGMTLMEQLVQQGVTVTMVSRRGSAGEPLPAGASIVAGDVNDPATVAKLAKGAGVVFETAQPEYTEWPEKWPPLIKSIIDGMAQTSTPLVFVDNLYMYGPTNGKPIREDMPYAATGRKGKTRAMVANSLLDAHKAGKIRVTIGRASDFYGPRVKDASTFGDRFFEAVWAGKPVDLFGNPDTKHTYTYVPDFAAALITLSQNEKAYGRAWHVPNAPAMTTREIVKLFETEMGQPIKSRVVSKFMVSMIGLFVPIVREMKELAYEFEEPYVVDDSQFRAAFGGDATSLPAGVKAMVAWYEQHRSTLKQAA